MKANDMRTGTAVRVDGRLYVVVRTEHTKPGKGPAYIQARLKDVVSGANIDRRFSSTDSVDDVMLDRRSMEFLYSDASGAVFMDNETFEQMTIPHEVLGDALLYLAPNTTVTVLCHEGSAVTLELPAAVELTVVETPPGIKGATATAQLKEATCDTGLRTRVPPFIAPGERIKVSTADGSYIARAKGGD